MKKIVESVESIFDPSKDSQNYFVNKAIKDIRTTNDLVEIADGLENKRKEEKRYGLLEGHALSSEDAGLVQGVTTGIVKAIKEGDNEKVLKLCNFILKETGDRERTNEAAIFGKETSDQQYFEDLVAKNLPGAEWIADTDGEMVVTTYNGVIQSFKNEIIKLANNLPERYFDDGLLLNPKRGLTIFNSKNGKNGANGGQAISWMEADLLSFIPVASAHLDLINDYNRIVKSNPRLLETFGGYVRVVEREKQSGNDESNDTADIIMSKPNEWAKGLEFIKTDMANRIRKAVKEGKYRSVLLVNDFRCLDFLFDEKSGDKINYFDNIIVGQIVKEKTSLRQLGEMLVRNRRK